MIVLETIDGWRRRVDFRAVGDDDTGARAAFARAAALARLLGLDDVHLHLGQDAAAPGAAPGDSTAVTVLSPAGPPAGPGTPSRVASPERSPRPSGRRRPRSAPPPGSDTPHVLHRWDGAEGVLEYETVFAHEAASRDLMALWVPLLLVTMGSQEELLTQLHTGLYEICANILEHGRPRCRPASFTIGLRRLPDRIDGFIQDCCEPFDSSLPPLRGVLQRVASREPRGFGLPMVLRLIDRLEHQYNATGNRLVFTKGMLP